MLSMMDWMSSASALSLGFPTSSAQAAMLRHMDPMASDPTPTACKYRFTRSVQSLQQSSACLNYTFCACVSCLAACAAAKKNLKLQDVHMRPELCIQHAE